MDSHDDSKSFKLFLKHSTIHACLQVFFFHDNMKFGNVNRLLMFRYLRTQKNEKSFICEIYNKAFSREDHLKCHLNIHSNEKCYICDTRKKNFFSNSLKTHLRFHTKENPYVWDICNEAFSAFAYSYKEKPYLCDIYNKAFSVNISFKMHLRNHTKEKPYLCDIYNKAFSVNISFK
ncbi:UNVERIFIED_CONTAM: Endothelial zinc finger protein induced by tumor necrosis factor alpha [Trichonephila clavipes]